MGYKFAKPTDNMMKLRTNRFGLMRQAYLDEINEQAEKNAIIESAENIDLVEAATIRENTARDRLGAVTERTEFLSNVKKSFLAECMLKLFKESNVTPMSKNDTVIARNLINNFINENGVGTILRDFKTKNLLLSEFNRITNKYYNKVLEACNKAEEDEYKKYDIDTDIKDDFFEELEDINTQDASKLIKQRVADSMDEFIDDNISNKMDYEDIIKSAKDKMQVMHDDDMVEECANRAYAEVNRLKQTRQKNIFNCLVESLTKASFTNENLKKAYFNESSVDMDSIVNSCQLMYTMLEMVNTTNMLQPITAEYLNKYLNSLTV